VSHLARLPRRRLAVAVALSLCAFAPALDASAAETSVAVVSLQPGASLGHVVGVEVLRTHDAVGVVVVEATERGLAALAASPAVRSMSPDVPVLLTGKDDSTAAGVYASTQVGPGGGAADAGRGVTVALVDTGVTDTPTLSRRSGRLIDGVDTSGEKTLTDGYGHGTAMANLIAGGSRDGMSPAVGVAPAATILSVKVAGADGTTSLSKVVAGLDYVVSSKIAHSTDVLSLSLSTTVDGAKYIATPLTDAVDRVREAGIVVVAAAGNDSSKVGAPAYDPTIIAVGAADTTEPAATVAPFSGSAVVAGIPRPDFVAPGVGVVTVLPGGSKLAREHAGATRVDGFWRSSGTSQATAVTAGAAAITLQRFPSASVHDVRFSLMSAAIPLEGNASGAGWMRLPVKLVTGTEYADGWRQVNDDGTMVYRPWTSSSWSSSSWSSSSWSSSSWSSSSWSSSSWSSSSWSSSSWSSSSWSSSSWSSSSWSASSSWSSSSWSSSSWSSSSWSASSSWSSSSWSWIK